MEFASPPYSYVNQNLFSGLLETYGAADDLFTLLYTTNVNSGVNPADVVNFNEIIAETAQRHGCTPENLSTYMGDRVLHPNYAGMDLIADCFLDALRTNYVTKSAD